MSETMKYIKKLPEPGELIERYPITRKEVECREKRLKDIYNILSGIDTRKIIIVGPCSADREDSVIEYTMRLSKLQEQVSADFLLIPRVYTSKPRTNGKGYKGLLHRPEASCNQDDIMSGVIRTRELHQKVIKYSGLFPADEMLYPEVLSYVSDLLVYAAVGARSVENQQHRLVASGLVMPVGMKNPTSGNLDIMIHAIEAAQCSQHLIFNGWEVETKGNPFAHAIIRGYTDVSGKARPNYYYENIQDLYDKCYKANLKNLAVIVDCNHCNSNKKYDEQGRIAEEVMRYCGKNKTIDRFVKGLMIESYLEDGAQMIGEAVYGKSITDPCLGWKNTEKLIMQLAEMRR